MTFGLVIQEGYKKRGLRLLPSLLGWHLFYQKIQKVWDKKEKN